MDDIRWLIAREIPHLRRFARALAADPQRADDLVQDCLERALRKHQLWHRRGSVRSWLLRMEYRVFINSEKRRRRERTVDLDGSENGLSVPASQFHRIECRDIGEALGRLPEAQRAAIVLIGVEQLRYEEAAAVLGVPVGTLRSRLSRARSTLRSINEHRGRARLRRIK